jgi:exonuclease III
MIPIHPAGSDQNPPPPPPGTNPNAPPANHPREHQPTNDYLKIATLNMRGRTSNIGGFRREKWFEIYGVLAKNKIAVLAIQESHLTDELATNINTAFKTKMHLTHSPLPETNNAAGVALVFNKGLINIDKITYETVIPGRAILTTIPWHANKSFKILNIYAPNDANANEKFWNTLDQKTTNTPHLKPDVILGDFNLVEDSLDRLPCHPDDPSAVAALGNLKYNLGLIDGWRRTNPNQREYSHQHAPNASQGRIDRIYVTNDILGSTNDWAIHPSTIETDHWIASAKISTPEAPLIGRGRWQIPLYVLENKDIIEDIDNRCKLALLQIESTRYRRTNDSNPQTIFANLKSEITNTCRNRAKVLHPTIKSKIEKLKSRLDSVNNNPHIQEDDKMLESIVIKTEMLELERTLFEKPSTH